MKTEMGVNLKKSIVLMLALVALLSLFSSGCSSGGNTPPTISGTQIYNATTTSPAITTTSPAVANVTLTVVIDGGGQTTPAAGKYTYPKGTVVNLAAIGDIHWTFNVWLGSVADARAATTTITLNSDQTVTAFFSPTMD
jgi:hypothetical protein